MQRGKVSTNCNSKGLRMVHMAVPGVNVGYCGVAVRAGSRNDGDGNYGLAHFVEHTIFKGTSKRRAWHIINRMEAIGGELNAFTTKEETVVFSVFPKRHLGRAAELIADLITSSRFPEHELEKEREVVADEIESYLDSPAEAVFDDFEDLIFAGSNLGHNILGTREALSNFSSDICRNYLRKWYVPSNMVVFYAGPQSAERVFAVLERTFECVDGAPPVESISAPPENEPFEVVKEIESHQCHTIVGARIGSMSSADRHTMALLTNILGGPGMNSMLNMALRERRGLVYSVDATTGLFSDCGSLAIYFGCDPSDNNRCRRLVKRTIDSLSDGYITSRRIEAAKKQFLGQVVIASENIENRILGIARNLLFLDKITTRAHMVEAINAIQPADIAAAAASLRLSTLTLGPA